MVSVEPRFKPEVECACGCGRAGRPRAKAWADGYHVRDCDCRRCRAGSYGKSERKRVRRFARRAGLTASSGSGRWNGKDIYGVLAVEETSARAIADGLEKWWNTNAVQDKIAGVSGQSLAPWGLLVTLDEHTQLFVSVAPCIEELCQAACGPVEPRP